MSVFSNTAFCIAIAIAVAGLGAVQPLGAWGEGVFNSGITEDAIGREFCSSNLHIITLGAESEAESDKSGPGGYRHFRDPDLLKSLNFVEREKRKVLNLSANADADQRSRVLALFHLGLLFRVLQDFYCNSNYIEMKTAQLTGSHKALDASELYNFELVDWNDLTRQLRAGQATGLRVDAFDKSDPKSDASSQKISGVSYFKLARELSVRETERQWHQIAALIRKRFQANGNAVLAALLKAGVENDLAQQIINDKSLATDE